MPDPQPTVDAGQSGGRGGAGGRGTGGTGGTGSGGRDAGAVDAARAPVDVVPPMGGGPLPSGGPPAMGVPREKILVFLHIGHSNMAGRTTIPANERPYFFETDPRLWSFHGMDMTNGRPPLLWRAAREPLSPDMLTGNQAGPGMAILRAAVAIAPPDVHVVSIGHGHSGERGGVCQNYKQGGLLYDIMMTPARALKGHVTFGGFFTMLGTTERHLDTSTQNVFADCMASIAASVRAELGDPAIPFMMSDFEMEATGETSPDLPYAKIIIAQLRQATMKIPRSALIPTENLGMDGTHHFNLAGYRVWATRGVQIMKEKGWAPWSP